MRSPLIALGRRALVPRPLGFLGWGRRSFTELPRQHTPPSAAPEPAPTGSQRLRQFFRQYGKLGVGVYLGVSAVTLGSAYLALRSGLDVPGLLIRIGVPEREWMHTAGTFAFAYALYKVAMPLRIFATIGLTGFIARRLRIGGPHNKLGR